LLGYTPAKYTEAVFLDAITKIKESARRYGKKLGILVADGKSAQEAKKEFDLVAIGTDVRAMQAWFRTALEEAKR
jgi:4-hydroxy-2-oxoheptanedioate aldolase